MMAWIALVATGLATLVVGATVYVWHRAQPAWGRARGLPPGSLGFATSMDAITDPDFHARAAARWGPVFKMAQFHRPVVVITDLPLGLQVLTGEAANLSQPRLPFGRLSPDNYVLFLDDRSHARYREGLASALRTQVVDACREGVASIVREQLRRLATEEHASGASPDPCIANVVLASMLRVMLGASMDEPRARDVRRLFAELGRTGRFTARRPEENVESYVQLIGFVRACGASLREQFARGEAPGPSVLAQLVRADASHLEDDTLLGNLVLLLHVTRSNVHGVLRWTVKELLDHPACALELRDAAAAHGEGSAHVDAMARHFVQEVLRLHQSEYFYREVQRDIRIGEYRIPKGWLVRVGVREAHDNPAIFPDPTAFRPARFATRTYDRTEYCPFSDGTHSRFGADVALLIARVTATVLATEFDARVAQDGPPERDGHRHWSHWRPSRALRVAVSARDVAS